MPHDYKAHFKKIDGGYQAWYGKKKKKIIAYVVKHKRGWTVLKGDAPSHLLRGHMKLADLKRDWEDWARKKWIERYMPTPNPTPPKPPPPPTYHPGTPRLAQAYCPPPPGKLPRNLEYEHVSDPFDPRFKYPYSEGDVYKRRQLTPLGVVVEVLAWCQRHSADISRVPAFAPVLDTVRECVHREEPKLYKELMK